jgi:acetyltransferase-like isoleucine patch superfamily enzyme
MSTSREAGSVAYDRPGAFRGLIRDSLAWLAAVLTAPLWLSALLQAWMTGGEGIFSGWSELLSLVPGWPGVCLRRGYYRMCLEAFALDCRIGFGTTLAHTQVRIAANVYIGNRCTLGQVDIGADTAIGSNVDILSGRHQHALGPDGVAVQGQATVLQRVRIGRNCWIGNSAVVMADVEDDCVVGAGSVVVHALPARSIAAGNPAVVKKLRDPAPAGSTADPLARSDHPLCYGS